MRAELARYRRASGDVGSDVASERVASCRPSAHVDYSTHSLADEHPHVTHRCVQCLLTRRTQLTLQLLHELSDVGNVTQTQKPLIQSSVAIYIRYPVYLRIIICHRCPVLQTFEVIYAIGGKCFGREANRKRLYKYNAAFSLISSWNFGSAGFNGLQLQNGSMRNADLHCVPKRPPFNSCINNSIKINRF